jgi:hypothetical protein
MPKRIEVLEKELADVESLYKELQATVPDPSAGPKGVRGKYPPGVVANVREKRDSLRKELAQARKEESPSNFVARKISAAIR